MTLLDRYLMTTIMRLTALVLLMIGGLEIFVSLLAEVGDIGQGNYGILQALYYVLLTLPMNIYELFPMVGLLGALMGLGVLASHQELMIMRASGMSVLQIARAVLRAAAVMILLSILVGECLAPKCLHLANTHKLLAESGGASVRHTLSGVWLHTEGAYIHIDQVTPDLSLQGITVYQFDAAHQLSSALYAKTATKENAAWVLHEVSTTILHPQGVSVSTQASVPWPVNINTRLLDTTSVQSAEMSLGALHHYIRDQEKEGMSVAAFRLVFWQRIFLPLASFVMILLAIPFVFGPLRSVSMGVRIVSGSALGFCFYLLNQFFGPFSLVYQIPPVMAAVFPVLLFGMLGAVLLRRLG